MQRRRRQALFAHAPQKRELVPSIGLANLLLQANDPTMTADLGVNGNAGSFPASLGTIIAVLALLGVVGPCELAARMPPALKERGVAPSWFQVPEASIAMEAVGGLSASPPGSIATPPVTLCREAEPIAPVAAATFLR